LRVSADGNEAARGLLENGSFLVSVGDEGAFEAATPSNPVSLGQFNANSSKDLYLALAVPGNMVLGGIVQFRIWFQPVRSLLYGKGLYGKGVFGEVIPREGVYPNTILYRAFVVTEEMWNELLKGLGRFTYSIEDDKQL
jgi:hypothetical protein